MQYARVSHLVGMGIHDSRSPGGKCALTVLYGGLCGSVDFGRNVYRFNQKITGIAALVELDYACQWCLTRWIWCIFVAGAVGSHWGLGLG